MPSNCCKVIFRENLPERTEALRLLLASTIPVIADDYTEDYRTWVEKTSSAEHIDSDAAVDKGEGHDEDEGEYEDEGEDEIQDDDDDSDEKECDLFDAELTFAWSLDSKEDHSQDLATDMLLRFCSLLVLQCRMRAIDPRRKRVPQASPVHPGLGEAYILFSIGISRGSAAAFLAQLRGSRAFAASQAARRLNATGREYMCDGTLSPMGEFLSLLSYGNDLRRSQGSSFRFYWIDDGKVLSWGGELWGQLVIVFDVGEVGHRGSILIRGASAVQPTPLTGHSRLNDYNRVGQSNQIKSNQTELPPQY
ncbi:Pumilio domain-containing protein C6G9.14 [Fusarium oxysporum f. sp. albedinis]|nr:Pumilio domain-containing protein C6G9.14 [Fusarium oxysporum f. sp. albedinis]